MLVLFAPIVRFLVSGASSLQVPFIVLLYSVIIFIVVPLTAGVVLRHWLIAPQVVAGSRTSCCRRLRPSACSPC
jgi:arsenite transporter